MTTGVRTAYCVLRDLHEGIGSEGDIASDRHQVYAGRGKEVDAERLGFGGRCSGSQ